MMHAHGHLHSLKIELVSDVYIKYARKRDIFFMFLLRFSLCLKRLKRAGKEEEQHASGSASKLHQIPPAPRQACVSGMVHAQDGVAVLNVCFEGPGLSEMLLAGDRHRS